MKVKFVRHADLVTAICDDLPLCQFPAIQGSKFEFPWTFCPLWLSWHIGGAYNYVASAGRLKALVRQALVNVSPQQFRRNLRKGTMEFGPVGPGGIPYGPWPGLGGDGEKFAGHVDVDEE